MKSENVVLTICLIVITIFLSGLLLTGCKSSSTSQNKGQIKSDSLSLIQANNQKNLENIIRNWSIESDLTDLEIEEYAVSDSCGSLRSVVRRRTKLKRNKTSASIAIDQSNIREYNQSTNSNHVNKDVVTSTEITRSLKASNTTFNIFIFCIFFIICFLVFKPPVLSNIIKFFRFLFKG